MSQKFRTISNAVTAGRKLNELTKKQGNVAFFMEPDGSTHICTLTDEEKVGKSIFSRPDFVKMILKPLFNYTLRRGRRDLKRLRNYNTRRKQIFAARNLSVFDLVGHVVLPCCLFSHIVWSLKTQVVF